MPLEVRLTVEKKKNVRQLKLALLWWTTMMAGQSGLIFNYLETKMKSYKVLQKTYYNTNYKGD